MFWTRLFRGGEALTVAEADFITLPEVMAKREGIVASKRDGEVVCLRETKFRTVKVTKAKTGAVRIQLEELE